MKAEFIPHPSSLILRPMTNTSIIGVGQTDVREHWETSIRHLAWYAIEAALDDAHIHKIDAIYVVNMLSGQLSNQNHLGALGADFAPEVVPGLAAAGSTFCTLAGALAVREALDRFSGGRLVLLTAAPAYKCPAAPYEAAMLLDFYLRRRGVRERTEIALYAAEPGPMGVAGPEVSAGVREMVESKGIRYYPGHQVKTTDAKARRLKFENGEEAPYDLLIHVPPLRPPGVVRAAGLAREAGWIGVDRHTLATDFERVFAVGDVTSIPLKLGKPLPKAGVFAHAEAEVVARNVAREVTGRGAPAVFDGHGECFVETGGGQAGFGAGNFYAEPLPQVSLHRPARRWHMGKVLLEKSWLWRWF